ncbi:hypothetical protein N7448_011296 [Penicillium atrosanguineum]|uniref:Uncharacterized protein n=1 Tax=Penicillium atrosanguineum TaxID=1132637 RepID=A0A9W9PYP0_9EURO|nr:hypothetical protein N7448_011296 [Penicillium atrosanguineum]KAJ5318619.1 hypothetical protein N7476_005039 [Penicillium atrosanguineum]
MLSNRTRLSTTVSREYHRKGRAYVRDTVAIASILVRVGRSPRLFAKGGVVVQVSAWLNQRRRHAGPPPPHRRYQHPQPSLSEHPQQRDMHRSLARPSLGLRASATVAASIRSVCLCTLTTAQRDADRGALCLSLPKASC